MSPVAEEGRRASQHIRQPGDGALTPAPPHTPLCRGPTGRVAAGGSLLLPLPEFLCGKRGNLRNGELRERTSAPAVSRGGADTQLFHSYMFYCIRLAGGDNYLPRA